MPRLTLLPDRVFDSVKGQMLVDRAIVIDGERIEVLTSGTNPGAPEFTEDELRAAVETAGEAGTHVAAHAHGAEGIKRAVRAGVRSIERAVMHAQQGRMHNRSSHSNCWAAIPAQPG